MVDQIIHTKSKAYVKNKLLISFFVLGLGISSAAFFFDNYWENLFLGIAFTIYLVHLQKTPRYWRLNKSKNLEVVKAGFSFSRANKQTTLPFIIPGIIIFAIVIMYLMDALLQLYLSKILLGLCVIITLITSSRKEIIFDYDNRFFTGLWNPPSFYDSDRQDMVPIRFDLLEDENGVVKIKITDKSGYYIIDKKDFPEYTWDRVLVNIERIVEMNTKSE